MINIHIIMKGLLDIAMAKNAGNIMKNNFKDILSEIKKGSK